MTLLRFSQPFALQGKCQGIVVTPFGAGHSIGGTVWKIKKDSENILYTVDYNHRKERHLNGSVLISSDALLKPTLLITDAYNALEPSPPPRKERDRALIATIMSVLDGNGNVLIPVENATRVLELAYLLDQHWAFNRVTHHLALFSHQSQNIITLARSMLEWMGDGISEAFAARELPFDFRYLKTISSIVELENLVGPKVILTTSPGMEFGYSKHLFMEWATDPLNMVILPDRGYPGTLTRKLYDFWSEHASTASPLREPVETDFDLPMEVLKLTRHIDEYRFLGVS
jgi:cleavage and polyadenylation specificity factor subunit 2